MDKQQKSTNDETSINLKLLDIFPSINDLKQQKNELDIIFQGLDIFHNLFELLSTKKEITLKTNNKSSIIISLIKLNNLFATSVFNIKQGDQWITFSYENKKKKDICLAKSLIDCIKIKLNCQIMNTKNIINNNILTTNTKKLKYFFHNNKLNYGSTLTEDNNNIKTKSVIEQNINKLNAGSKILTNKGNKKICLESSPKEVMMEKSKFTWVRNNNSIVNDNSANNHNQGENILNKKKSFLNDMKSNHQEKGLRRMKTKNSYSKIMDEDLAIRLNKIVHKNDENKLNLTQRNRKNNNSNGNLDYSMKGNKHYNNLLFNNFDSNKNQKNKQMLKNRLLYNTNKKTEIKNITNEYNNKKNETEISINNVNNINDSNNYDINISRRRKYNNKVERSHDAIENINVNLGGGTMTNRRNKDVIRDLKNNTSTNAKTPEITRSNKYNNKSNNFKNTIESEKYLLNEDRKNRESSILKNISSDFDNDEKNKIFDDLSNISNNENDNYLKLREDFILLYNDYYVKNVQEDLLKLEIELFVEKMTGLISAYHYEINEKKIQNKILENNLKENSGKYLNLCKLYCRLNILKKNFKKKHLRLFPNKTNIKEINNKNFETNKKEIELFKLIFQNKKDENKLNDENKNKKLKNILNFILSKIKNKNNIINTDLYKKWCKINTNENKIENKDINNKKEEGTKYKRPIARTRVIPKLQQTKFNSKINNLTQEDNTNSLNLNENKSEKKIFNNKKDENSNYNYFTHNPNTDIYSKNSAAYSLYPKKFYSRKIPK